MDACRCSAMTDNFRLVDGGGMASPPLNPAPGVAVEGGGASKLPPPPLIVLAPPMAMAAAAADCPIAMERRPADAGAGSSPPPSAAWYTHTSTQPYKTAHHQAEDVKTRRHARDRESHR